jgi:hypothetical protein
MPATAPSGTVISGSYRATSASGEARITMRLAYTFVVGTTYNITFTGMQGSTDLGLRVYQYNPAGNAYTQIDTGFSLINTTAATISGSFTPSASGVYTGTIIFFIQALSYNPYVNFTAFSMTVGEMNVGIGMSNPIAKLQINQDGNSTANEVGTHSLGILSSQGTSGTNRMYMMLDADFTNQCCSIQSIIYGLTVWNLNLNPRGGNVGIGTTNPGAVLHVNDSVGTATSAPIMLFSPNLTAGGIQYLYFGRSNSANNSAQLGWTNVGTGSASNYAFLQIFGKANIMTWQASSGNVGIGITNPSKKLFIKEDTILPTMTSAQDLPAQFALQSNTSWLKLGQYYQGGVGAWGIIQSSDYYSSAEHGINLGLNPLDGKVSVGGQEMSGTATRNPGGAMSRFTIHSDYADSNSGFAINASDGATDNYYMKLYPYVVAGGIVGYNFLTFNNTTSYSPFSFNRNLVGINNTSPSYPLDISGQARVLNGSMVIQNGNDSMTYYGPNSAWSSYLVVGAGTDKTSANTAQVISTNGNLHMDAGDSKDMYYGYYPSSRGAPNTHQFYGTSVNFPSGLPQNTTSLAQVAVFDGNTLKKSQAVQKLVYFNNNVAWSGGVNMTYAFYLYNTACNVQIWGKNSGYYSGSGMMQTTIRCYSQSSGAYYYFPINAYVNIGGNHFTVPLNYASSFPTTGWYDIYVYSTSGWITDGNDQLTIGVTILPAGGF